MTARSEFRSNAKAHRFVMNRATYVIPQPQRATWPRRLAWAAFGALFLLGLASFGLFMVGAALTFVLGG